MKCFLVNLSSVAWRYNFFFCFFCFFCERLALILTVQCFLFQLVSVIQPDQPHYIVNATLENVSAYQESVATNVTAVQEEQRDKYRTVSLAASALIIGIVLSRNSKVSALQPTFVLPFKITSDFGPMKYRRQNGEIVPSALCSYLITARLHKPSTSPIL